MRTTSTDHCAITVTATPGSRRADVRICGVISTAAEDLLAEAVRQLAETSPRSVFIDLSEVRSAGPTLPEFLRQVHDRTPRGSSLVVCRPDPLTRRLLTAAGVLPALVVCDSLLG